MSEGYHNVNPKNDTKHIFSHHTISIVAFISSPKKMTTFKQFFDRLALVELFEQALLIFEIITIQFLFWSLEKFKEYS